MKKLLVLLPILFLWFPNVSHAALTTNLVSYWKMDGNSNSAVGSFNGTDTAITYSTGNGIINQGAGFNGSTSGITTPNTATDGDLTVNFWVKIGSYNATDFLIADWNSPYNFLIYTNSTGTKISVQLNGGGDFPTGSLSTGVWYMITVVRSGTTGYVYVNGTQVNTITGLSAIGASTGNIQIGSNQGLNSFYNGAEDEIGIWSRALTTTEITQLYNGGTGLQYPFTTASALTSILSLVRSFWLW